MTKDQCMAEYLKVYAWHFVSLDEWLEAHGFGVASSSDTKASQDEG